MKIMTLIKVIRKRKGAIELLNVAHAEGDLTKLGCEAPLVLRRQIPRIQHLQQQMITKLTALITK